MIKFLRVAIYKLRNVYCPVCEFPKKKVGEDMCQDCKLKEVSL